MPPPVAFAPVQSPDAVQEDGEPEVVQVMLVAFAGNVMLVGEAEMLTLMGVTGAGQLGVFLGEPESCGLLPEGVFIPYA